jgi:hypothetical protein
MSRVTPDDPVPLESNLGQVIWTVFDVATRTLEEK